MACFHCSDLLFGDCCEYTNMPKIKSKGEKVAMTAKTRSLLRSEASARELADGLTFACTTCAHTVTRARNLRYHMCEMHNMWCVTLRQTSSFPQPDSVFRAPTASEYEKYGHGKPLPTPKRVKKFVPNQVVYEDISGDDNVPNTTPVGVDEPYDDPVLSRVRLRSYPAAAGSTTQTVTDVVVMRGIDAGPPSHGLLLDDVLPLHVTTQTDRSYRFFDVILDHIEHYVRQAPLPWRVRALLPRLFRILPNLDTSMLAISLASVIRGIRIASESILRESAAQPILRFEGRDVLILEDRLVYLMNASGEGPVV